MPKPLQPVSLFGLAAQGETGSLALKSSASGFFGRLGIAGNFCPPPAVGISGVGRGAQRKALFCLTGPPTPTLRLASAFILCIASCFQTLLQVLRRAVAPSGRHVWQSGREEDDESAAGRLLLSRSVQGRRTAAAASNPSVVPSAGRRFPASVWARSLAGQYWCCCSARPTPRKPASESSSSPDPLSLQLALRAKPVCSEVKCYDSFRVD